MADVSYVKVAGTTYTLNDVDAEQKIAQKMTLVSSATSGNVAILDSNGQVKDSGGAFSPSGIGAIPTIGGGTVGNIPIIASGGILADSTMTLEQKLTVRVQISSNDNLNNYTTECRAYCNTNAIAATVTNIPTSSAGYLDVYTTGGNFVFQVYQTYNDTGMYTRARTSASDWTDWRQEMRRATGATNNHVATLDADGQVKDSGKELTASSLGFVTMSNSSDGVTGAVSAAPSSSQFVRLRVTDPRAGGGDYIFYATDTGISLFNMGSSSLVWSSNQTNTLHLLHKTVTGTTNSTSGFISLGLDSSYGLMAVRSADSTYVVLPYYATSSATWYALVLNNAMSVQKGVSVNLDVDYYAKL